MPHVRNIPSPAYDLKYTSLGVGSVKADELVRNENETPLTDNTG